MKKILIFAIALTAFSLTSCKDFLDVKPMGTPNQDGYFTNDFQVENAVKSIYAPLADGDDLFGRDSHWEQCTGIFMVPGRTRDWPQLFTLQWNGDESPLKSVFEKCYKFGNRANWIVYSLEKKLADEGGLNYVYTRSLGEAYFIRAWLHLTIAYRYGTGEQGCPWVNYESFLPGGIQTGIPPQKASVTDNYDMIIKDLKRAEQLLPSVDDYSVAEQGRACKESACAMQARAYAYWATWDESQWDNVITVVDKLENDYHRNLLPNFEDNFNEYPETWWNSEYCWSIASNGGFNARTGMEFPGVCLENKGWGVFNGWGQFKPSYDAYEELAKDGENVWSDPEDPSSVDKIVNVRLARTILEYGQPCPFYGNEKFRYYGAQDVETGFQINKWMAPFAHADFVNTGYVNNSGDWPTARVNFHVIRFADCLLLRAEAKLHRGGDAAADINRIRTRAKLTPTTETNLWLALFHERNCELMFENLADQTYDLKRWAIGAGVDQALKSKAILALEAHPRALYHVYRDFYASPIGQKIGSGIPVSGDSVKTDSIGRQWAYIKANDKWELAKYKAVIYPQDSIKLNLAPENPGYEAFGEYAPGVGEYKDFQEMAKTAKWSDHLAVFPYPSEQITKSNGELKQNKGYDK